MKTKVVHLSQLPQDTAMLLDPNIYRWACVCVCYDSSSFFVHTNVLTHKQTLVCQKHVAHVVNIIQASVGFLVWSIEVPQESIIYHIPQGLRACVC